jgi:hypothetical protein
VHFFTKQRSGIDDDACISIACANYFVETGDVQTAAALYQQYPTHPLVGPKGVIVTAVSTRVLHDLIGDRYVPTLHLNISNDVRTYLEHDVPGVDEVEQLIVREELRSGRLRDSAEYVAPFPLVAVLAPGNHAVLLRNKREMIDDGVAKPYCRELSSVCGAFSFLKL